MSNSTPNIKADMSHTIDELNEDMKNAKIYDPDNRSEGTIDSSEIPEAMTDDESYIRGILSEIDDDTTKSRSTASGTKVTTNKGAEKYSQEKLTENILNYLKIDDMIKEKNDSFRKEITPFKQLKNELEVYLIEYLDKMENDVINIGETNRIEKVETEVKSPITYDNIADGVIECLKTNEVSKGWSEDKLQKIIKDMIQRIDAKRNVKKTKKLVRKMEKEKKTKDNASKSSKSTQSTRNKKINSKTAKNTKGKVTKGTKTAKGKTTKNKN